MVKKNIYIVGGDGFARECYTYIQRMSYHDSEISFSGFLGEGGYRADFKEFSSLFVGDVSDFNFTPQDYAVIGSGNPSLRKKIYQQIKQKGGQFINVIDPSTVMFSYVNMGDANIFTLNCMVASQTKIGNGNLFNGFISIGHDAQVGDFNFIAPSAQILGGCKIGNENSLGTSSVLLPHSKIGNNNKIAPLSAVYKGCKDGCTMVGNPARNIGEIK